MKLMIAGVVLIFVAFTASYFILARAVVKGIESGSISRSLGEFAGGVKRGFDCSAKGECR